METPKLSAIVAPMTANVSAPASAPLPSKDGEYAIKGTLSLVWSLPVCVGSFPWSAVNISKSFSFITASSSPSLTSKRSSSSPYPIGFLLCPHSVSPGLHNTSH